MNRMGEHFKEEITKANNGKLMAWGEIRIAVEQKDNGEPVLLFVWQDQTVVRGMTTAHDGEGYMLRNRRRPKQSSSMNPLTRSIFDIPKSTNMPPVEARKFYSSKLALPVIRAIDDYNYNMNGVNIADQLREEYSIAQITVRSWLVYLFWLFDCAIINSFILWRTEIEQMVVGRKDEHMRLQRVYREAIIKYLLKESPEPRLRFRVVVITKYHQFIEPNIRIALRFHQLQHGLPPTRCYLCRIKYTKGEMLQGHIALTRYGCMVCELPLCDECFEEYHGV
jgi:hypothetical protein